MINLSGKRRIRLILLASLLILLWVVMGISGGGEVYARRIYPLFYALLTPFSSFFPFSIGDCFIYGSITGLLIYLVCSLFRRKPFGKVLLNMVEYLAWVYVWFYLAWGLNYFRQDFYRRTQTPYASYTVDSFRSFLTDYTEKLNRSYVSVPTLDREQVREEIGALYPTLAKSFHLLEPDAYLRSKPMLFTSLMSGVGVLGYIGPFFLEYHINSELLPEQYPFTCAHEMAHVLGVSSEAEANLCAYLICTGADDPAIRFSGYFSLLPYVLDNACRLLGEKEFGEWTDCIRSEVKVAYRDKAAYWQARYNPVIGKMQDVAYNLFLKGNNIPSGQKNYSEVIGLLISFSRYRPNGLMQGVSR